MFLEKYKINNNELSDEWAYGIIGNLSKVRFIHMISYSFRK